MAMDGFSAGGAAGAAAAPAGGSGGADGYTLEGGLAQKMLLETAIFIIENFFSLGVASTCILVFCVLTRLFTNNPSSLADGEGESGRDSPAKPSKEPRPRWEVLRTLNYFVIGTFITSITYVMFNYQSFARDDKRNGGVQLVPIVVIWSFCMAYFFGFFGISFLDMNAIMRSPSSFGLSHLDSHLARQEQDSSSASSSASSSPSGSVSSSSSSNSSKGDNSNAMCSVEIPGALQVEDEQEEQQEQQQQQQQQQRPEPLAAVPEGDDYAEMTDDEIIACVKAAKIKDHQLEAKLGDCHRAVLVRRKMFEGKLGKSLDTLPMDHFDYDRVLGANCEIVCGYVPLPVGIVGPLLLNGKETYVPMATTEGCLVASTNRGCKAISQGGGAQAAVLKDGITRAPCLRMPSAMRAAELKQWMEDPDNFETVREAFESTTSFGKLKSVGVTVAGRNVYTRFVCFSGDAMGMNMISKGCLAVMEVLEHGFPDMELIAISGNMCTDKKPAAINWIEGRGKSVVCEVRIPGVYVESTLKTTVRAMVETNIQKNLIGSAMAGALGGFNAHASNIVTAVFLATGQDPAQNVESSTCMTIMEAMDNGDLLVSVNMPSIEVGTVGGGTSLPAQAACLDVMGCRGASKEPLAPGDNAKEMSMMVAATVLAGELSLVAALASNQLVRAHMTHNRKKA